MITVNGNNIVFTTENLPGSVEISLHKTYRVPDNQSISGLPPNCGRFEILNVNQYEVKLPRSISDKGGVLVPIRKYEALWLNFKARPNRPSAIQICAGKINCITGQLYDGFFTRPPLQDYVVVGGRGQSQRWLDGWKTQDGIVRQFIATEQGEGQSIEQQLTGKEEHGGIQLMVVEAHPHLFQPEPQPESILRSMSFESYKSPQLNSSKMLGSDNGSRSFSSNTMNVGMGGKIEQMIYADTNNPSVWNSDSKQKVWVHLINPDFYEYLTGIRLPIDTVIPRWYASQNWHMLPQVMNWYKNTGETILNSLSSVPSNIVTPGKF